MCVVACLGITATPHMAMFHSDQYTGRQTQAANWEELFKLITRDRFPALQEVQLTYESELWPASE